MQKTFAQARIVTTIKRSGLTDAQIAEILSVNQSTVSRIKNGLIQKVGKYQNILDNHLNMPSKDSNDEILELIEMAERSPSLREVLIAIKNLMQKNA